ncbi:MAG: hypothetical protein QE283_11115 [Rhodoferax sp.]|nr:hypothetical protein [Rhodoferax sp.]
MIKVPGKQFAFAMLFALASVGAALAQDQAGTEGVPEKTQTQVSTQASFDKALQPEANWYFSWGYSRQQYAPSDIRVSQPGLGNDFTLHQVAASDFPTTVEETFKSITEFELTGPQENIRIGKFLNPEKTFAIEFSLDHSKYNADLNQTVRVSGTRNGQPYNGSLKLTENDFYYALHNGLNHIMINAVWLQHLHGPENKPGDLQLISRAGAGILLPHADNVIFGNANQVGPKNENVCCTSSKDWWQINGWTAGVEVGLRYRVYKSLYLELTSKVAYGVLRGVPVFQGTADQTIWMSEQVLSTGFLF